MPLLGTGSCQMWSPGLKGAARRMSAAVLVVSVIGGKEGDYKDT